MTLLNLDMYNPLACIVQKRCNEPDQKRLLLISLGTAVVTVRR
jgi:hypothetical protein